MVAQSAKIAQTGHTASKVPTYYWRGKGGSKMEMKAEFSSSGKLLC